MGQKPLRWSTSVEVVLVEVAMVDQWPASDAPAADPGTHAAAEALITATRRLRGRVSHWTAARWAAPCRGAHTRADQMHVLVQRVADLAADAEGLSHRAVPRLESDLALPDQLQVMVDDLVAAAGQSPLLEAATVLVAESDALLTRSPVDGLAAGQ